MSIAFAPERVIYPDSDGKPMAENTLQYLWIVTIQGNLSALFRERADVFVAGDNLIYPVQGSPEICLAPDVYVAFGRPKGVRGSYKVWDEGGIFPQAIFEIRSPSNTAKEMREKLAFYEKHGAQEYYDYDPDRHKLRGYRRQGRKLIEIDEMDGWVSPLLGIRFQFDTEVFALLRPDGSRFLTFDEMEDDRVAERERAEAAEKKARAEFRRANKQEQRAEEAEAKAHLEAQRAEKFRKKMLELGLDPEAE